MGEMTEMQEAEQFLRSWKISNDKIKLSKDRIVDLENLRIYPGGGGFEERIQGGSHLQRYEKYAEIDERIEKELAKVEEETAKCKKVEDILQNFSSENEQYAILLRYVYTTELSTDQISEHLNYSKAWIYKHKLIAKPMFAEWFIKKSNFYQSV